MSKVRTLIGTLALLLVLGMAGYAYLSPPFAATCKSTYAKGSAWVRQQTDALVQTYKKSPLCAAVNRKLHLRETVLTQKKAEAAKAKAEPKPPLSKAAAAKAKAKNKPLSAAALRQQERANWTPGQKIAKGQAFKKCGSALGFTTDDQMASHIDRVISFAGASNTKQLSRGRTAYWDERTKSVFIVDPNSSDGGSALKPQQGRSYFDSLK